MQTNVANYAVLILTESLDLVLVLSFSQIVPPWSLFVDENVSTFLSYFLII